MPHEISISNASGWRDVSELRSGQAQTRYLVDGDYKRGILGKIRVLWLNGNYVRCPDGGICLFDGKTTTAALQNIYEIWTDPERRDEFTWTEELAQESVSQPEPRMIDGVTCDRLQAVVCCFGLTGLARWGSPFSFSEGISQISCVYLDSFGWPHW